MSAQTAVWIITGLFCLIVYGTAFYLYALNRRINREWQDIHPHGHLPADYDYRRDG